MYCNFIIKKDQFFLISTERKQINAKKILIKIEHIIAKKLKNANNLAASEKETISFLIKKADSIRKGFIKKSKKVSPFFRFLGRVSKKEKNIENLFLRIKNRAHPPSIIPKIHSIVDQLVLYLEPKDWARFSCVNRDGSKKTYKQLESLKKNIALNSKEIQQLKNEIILGLGYYEATAHKKSIIIFFNPPTDDLIPTLGFIRNKYFFHGVCNRVNVTKTLSKLRSISVPEILSLSIYKIPTLNLYLLKLVKARIVKPNPYFSYYFNQLISQKQGLDPVEIELYVRLGAAVTDKLVSYCYSKTYHHLMDFFIQSKRPITFVMLQLALQYKDSKSLKKMIKSCTPQEQDIFFPLVVYYGSRILFDTFLNHASHAIDFNYKQGEKNLLAIAAQRKDYYMMGELIKRGSKPDLVLHYIAREADIGMLNFIKKITNDLSISIDVNTLNSQGRTPLAEFLTSPKRTPINEKQFINSFLEWGAVTSIFFAFDVFKSATVFRSNPQRIDSPKLIKS